MGLLSKKEYVCEACGKTFEKRINFNGNFCDTCWSIESEKRNELMSSVRGYAEYAQEVLGKNYTSDEMKRIIEHRDYLVKKYSNQNGISKQELQEISDNYKKLSDEEVQQVLGRISNANLFSGRGAVCSDYFFALTDYPKVIVDFDDVFAVGYTTDHRNKDDSKEAILCAIFTNDPYVPVFPMVYVACMGMLEFKKSKTGRKSVEALFEHRCRNLKYPVEDLKKLKKLIKQVASVNGNMDAKFMLTQIENAMSGVGVFDTSKVGRYLYGDTVQMLDEMGYIQDDDVKSILGLDSFFTRRYWTKQIKKFSK